MRLVRNSEVNQLLNELLDLGWVHEFRSRHLILRDPYQPSGKAFQVTVSYGNQHQSCREVRSIKLKLRQAQERAVARFKIAAGQMAVELPANAPAAMKKQLKALQRNGLLLRSRT